MKIEKLVVLLSIALLVLTASMMFFAYAITSVLGIGVSVITWPLFLSMGLMLLLIPLSALVSLRAKNKWCRLLGWLSIALASACFCYILYWALVIRFDHPTDRYVLPQNLRGEVLIFHEVPGALQGSRSFYRRRTYQINDQGVIAVPTRDASYVEFFVKDTSGVLRVLPEFVPSSEIPVTSLTVDRTVYVLNEGSSGYSSAGGCGYEIHRLFIGTKAEIINRSQDNRSDTAQQNPNFCAVWNSDRD